MNIAKSYLTDGSGKSVILDEGLMKAIEEVQDEETVKYEKVREFISNVNKKLKIGIVTLIIICCIFRVNSVYSSPKFLTLPLNEESVVANGWYYSAQSDSSRSKHCAIDYYK